LWQDLIWKRQLEKNRKQAEKAAREESRRAKDEARRQRAASRVSGQPIIHQMQMMDQTAEETLKIIINNYKTNDNYNLLVDLGWFPAYIEENIQPEFEKLVQYGMISVVGMYPDGAEIMLLPPAFTYFSRKEEALKKAE
jgi:hypothetical protein